MAAEKKPVMEERTAKVGEMAPNFVLTDTEGKKHALEDFEGRYVILEWINFDCPFVQKHYKSGNMQELQETYKDQKVVWLTICSSAPGKQGYFEGEALKSRMEKEKWNGTAYLIDESGKVGKMYQAKTTPHMYIINPEGMLIYAGAIDDKPSANVDDITESTNYVKQAMSASMAGEEVPVKTTVAYGCSVKYQ
ncbi:MAG: redoxin domain-containing protein [Aliifodinibius sp.]|nr:thioredoxin family protein [candidate division Zixibacteria bacterium]NIT61306.1 thioredoxin family protein [Fodinibius sp.]NIW42641.1 redoxin domain-containing protein [candidate division Zixibacteria bacterium]NIX59243.1 redoxin domain-containing protein [candidate division Zixibacteria bacterium]NIY29886.1 redoxin domain-containing protein [Fodinibius sp.]